MGQPSFQASNALIYVTYGLFLLLGTGLAWRMRKQSKSEFLAGNRTQTAFPLALNFIAAERWHRLISNGIPRSHTTARWSRHQHIGVRDLARAPGSVPPEPAQGGRRLRLTTGAELKRAIVSDPTTHFSPPEAPARRS
ncbi:hypothetical protein F4778DRAFT_783191 [Xylariomycetidae sp. FL2044]|nr:hypothetical protein F4778DRAFT_783191 [Xylariomycetidae sp. FL2044]